MERPSSDELISAYFDDETTPEENVVVERLLADPKHRQALEEYRQLREELRSMPAPKLDADWSARLKQRLVAAKPEWTGKPAGAAKDAVVAPALVASPAETAASGGAEKPMPASLDASRGDGYSRFRHLWLTAGVGVAAGTLGIVIGWSAQNRLPGDVAYDTGAAAPTTAASPAAVSGSDFEPTPSLEEQGQEALSAGAATDFAMNGDLPEVAANSDSLRNWAAPHADEAASAPEPWSSELSGLESAQRMSRSESVPPIPGPPQIAERVADAAGDSVKKAEKQLEGVGGAMPPVELAVEPSIDLSAIQQENEVLEREASSEGTEAERYTTYVGVWNRTSDELSAEQVRGVVRQIDAFANRARLGAADASGQAMEESFESKVAPALVLEGSPEHVAAALEVLARDRTRGEVRLLERVSDAEERSYYERSRRLNEVESRLQRQLASDQRESHRRKEDLKDIGAGEDRYAADDQSPPALAFGATASPIDRIEAFFFDDAMARGSLAEGAPSNGMLAGSSFGSGGGGFGGGFGGIGGGALPSTSGYGPPQAAMPSINGPFAEAPPADAFAASDPKSNPAGGAAPAAAQPSASRVRAADLAQSRGGAVPQEPGAAPQSGPAGAATEAAGIAASRPRSAPAMAGQPAPPAPAPDRADATPPPPAEVKAAASNASGAAGEGGAIGKSNRFTEGAPFGGLAMPSPLSLPAGGEAEVDAVPSDEPSPPAPSDALRSELEMAEQKLASESLLEAAEFASPEDRRWFEGKFLAPSPERVRVILFASESSTPQLPVTGVPAGPAAALAPATPAAPAAAMPAAESAPAGSAPASDR